MFHMPEAGVRPMTTDALDAQFPTKGDWTPSQLKLAFLLYLQLPFGQFHKSNVKVQSLASLIGRSPSAVAMKLSNFASLDPAQGGKGLHNASAQDRRTWNDFHRDWEGLVLECEQLCARLIQQRPDLSDPLRITENPAADYTGLTRDTLVKQRVGQALFRRSVLASYGSRCCISGLADSRLLVASHIVAWSDDPANRLNPRNGLCLSALHDRAFDAHLITLDTDLRVVVAEQLLRLEDDLATTAFARARGKPITLPERFHPDEAFLARHRQRFEQMPAIRS
jgi:hypothetical protein